LERLKNNQIEEPFFVACITAYFIQQISEDLQNQSKSQFRDLITKFQSKSPLTEKQIKTSKLGLWGVFDFLINYMSDLEDQIRAKAMAICGQSYLTKNDKAQIISSLVMAIYPHCKPEFPKNFIGNFLAKLLENPIKLGIKYVSAKHINRSISISQTLPIGNPCEIVIR